MGKRLAFGFLATLLYGAGALLMWQSAAETVAHSAPMWLGIGLVEILAYISWSTFQRRTDKVRRIMLPIAGLLEALHGVLYNDWLVTLYMMFIWMPAYMLDYGVDMFFNKTSPKGPPEAEWHEISNTLDPSAFELSLGGGQMLVTLEKWDTGWHLTHNRTGTWSSVAPPSTPVDKVQHAALALLQKQTELMQEMWNSVAKELEAYYKGD